MNQSGTRKLAAIMFTDVVGYTTLMQKDERKARDLIRRHRELMKSQIERYGGKVLQYMGDGTLCTFASAIEAVRCGIEIQRALLDEDKISLRIGIHVGDVVVEGDEIYGDGVNVASRLEPLARPGEICISGRVYDEIRNQAGISAVSLGRRKLKNVQKPVEVFVLTGRGISFSGTLLRFFQRSAVKRGFISAVGIIAFVLIYILILREAEPVYGDAPSVGVLYLDNLGAAEDEYFSYGITEDLIIDLSKAGLIRVPPMKDILPFRESNLSLSEITMALRVRFILTGSIRREAESFRLAVQLIEPAKGKTLWSDRWEEPLSEASAIKGRMIREVIAALGLTPNAAAAQAMEQKPTTDADAYEFYLKGKYRWEKRRNLQDVEVARALLKRAIELDGNFLSAKLKLGQSFRETGDYVRAMEIYQECLEQSRELGDRAAEAMAVRNMGNVYLARGNYDTALEYYERSLTMARNLGDKLNEESTLRNIGSAYYNKGNNKEALRYYTESLDIALKLGDRRGEGDTYHNLGSVYEELEDHDKALDSYGRSLAVFRELGEKNREVYPMIAIGLIYSDQGNFDSASGYLEKSLEMTRDIGDKSGEVYSLIYIGDVYYQINQSERAVKYYQQSLEMAQSIGDAYNEGISRQSLGELMVQKGEYVRSSRYFESACSTWKEIGDSSQYAWSLSWWALSELKSGNIEAASTKAAQTEKIMAETQQDEENTVAENWNLFRVYSGMGEAEKAKSHLLKAYTGVMSHADRFKDPEQRRTFLENIREHREVISAHRQIGEKGG